MNNKLPSFLYGSFFNSLLFVCIFHVYNTDLYMQPLHDIAFESLKMSEMCLDQQEAVSLPLPHALRICKFPRSSLQYYADYSPSPISSNRRSWRGGVSTF